MGLVESYLFPGTSPQHKCNKDVPIIWLEECNNNSNSGLMSSACGCVSTEMPRKQYACIDVGPTTRKKTEKSKSGRGGKNQLAQPCIDNNNIIALYFHGNSEDLCNVYPRAETLSNRFGIHIVCPEYSGYGVRKNRGTASESECYAIADASMQYIAKHYPTRKILVLGCSIGTGLASYVAFTYPEQLFGVVLVSPYTSIRDLVYEYIGYAAYLCVSDLFPTLDRLRSYQGRLIVIHGKEDQVISYKHSQTIFHECTSPNKHLFIHPQEEHNWSNLIHCVVEPVLQTWFNTASANCVS